MSIIFNTLHHASGTNAVVSIRSSAGRVVLRNNIIMHSTSGAQALLLPMAEDVALIESDYNVLIGDVSANGTVLSPASWVAMGHDEHSVVSASIPAVVIRPTGLPEGDYHLIAASPATDAGANIAYVTTDADGMKRPQRINSSIGAYEWVAAQGSQ